MLYQLFDEMQVNKYAPKVQKRDFIFPPELLNIRAIMYSVLNPLGGESNVFAFVGYPSTPMPKDGYPAAVLVHGGGGMAYFEWIKKWTDKGYVAIAPDFDSQLAVDLEHRREVNTDGGAKGYGSWDSTNNPKSSWVFFSVFSIGCAVNVLSGISNVNKNKIALSGISWGGFLSLTAAAVDKRFKALSVIYSSAFISDSVWGHEHGFSKLTKEQQKLYNAYFDPQGYIDGINIPVLFAAGTDDHAFTVFNRKRTSDKIPSKKYFSYRLDFPHGHVEGFDALEQIAFTDEIFNNKTVLTDCSISKDNAVTIRKGKFDIESVKLIYTTEDITKKDICKWQSLDLPQDKLQFNLIIPSSANAYFLQITDSDGLTISSDLFSHL